MELSDFVKQQHSVCEFDSSDSWVILTPIEQSIKRKIEAVGTPLKDWDIQINYGIKTGYNDAFIISTEKRNEILANCQTEDERARTAELIRPILRGRDIKRYSYDWADLWLINTHNGIKGVKERIHIEDYPAIKAHLDQYWDKISKRADKGDTPYNLRNCAYLDDFSKPKIVWAETMRIHRGEQSQHEGFPRFTVTLKDVYLDKTCFFLHGNSLNYEYLLGIMNSSLFKDWIRRNVSTMDNGGFLMQKIYLEQMPIPLEENIYSVTITNLVKKILSEISKEKVMAFEKAINGMVYEMFNLTPEEIKFIENQ